MGKPGKKWLEGLEPPGVDRRLRIAENLGPNPVGLEGAKRSVRVMNPRSKGRHPCFVCGRHRYISQAHHLIEVGRVANVLDTLAIWDWSPSIPLVSLCPNHHAYLHAINRAKGKARQELSEALGQELSECDWDRLIEIDDQRLESQDRVWREVREEFLRREEEYHRPKSEE